MALGMVKSQISCNHCNGEIIEYYDEGLWEKEENVLVVRLIFP